jgi:glycosyltransferase 2 family protein
MQKRFRWVSLGLAGLVLGYVAWHLRLDTLGQKLGTLNWPLLLAAVGLGVVSVALQALRWRYLLRPAPVRYVTVLQATYLGALTNQLLPLRTGELVRGLLVSRRTGLGLAAVLSTEAVERLSDALAVAALILLAVRGLELPAGLKLLQLFLVGLIVALLGAALFVATRERYVHERLDRWNPQKRWAVRVKSVSQELTVGIGLLRNWRAMAVSFGVALSMAGLQVFIFWLALRAYRLEMTPLQAAAVLAVISIGTVFPNAPGNLGSWQFFCMLGLTLVGIDSSTAAGFSVVAFAVLYMAMVVGGLVALATSPFTFSQLRGMRHPGAEPLLLDAAPEPEA